MSLRGGAGQEGVRRAQAQDSAHHDAARAGDMQTNQLFLSICFPSTDVVRLLYCFAARCTC